MEFSAPSISLPAEGRPDPIVVISEGVQLRRLPAAWAGLRYIRPRCFFSAVIPLPSSGSWVCELSPTAPGPLYASRPLEGLCSCSDGDGEHPAGTLFIQRIATVWKLPAPHSGSPLNSPVIGAANPNPNTPTRFKELRKVSSWISALRSFLSTRSCPSRSKLVTSEAISSTTHYLPPFGGQSLERLTTPS